MIVSAVGVGDGVAVGVGRDDGMIVALAVGNGPAADGAGVGVARLLADGVAQAAGYRRQGGCGRSGWSTRWARRWGWGTELGRRWSVCRRGRGRGGLRDGVGEGVGGALIVYGAVAVSFGLQPIRRIVHAVTM